MARPTYRNAFQRNAERTLPHHVDIPRAWMTGPHKAAAEGMAASLPPAPRCPL